MNLNRLCKNTVIETTPLYKIKVGSPVYLFTTIKDEEHYALDDEAHLRGKINPSTGKVILIDHEGKKVEFEEFRCVVVK
jgi:hypothetical protein